MAFQNPQQLFAFREIREIYLRQEVCKRSLFALCIFCHLLSHLRSELRNTRYNTQHLLSTIIDATYTSYQKQGLIGFWGQQSCFPSIANCQIWLRTNIYMRSPMNWPTLPPMPVQPPKATGSLSSSNQTSTKFSILGFTWTNKGCTNEICRSSNKGWLEKLPSLPCCASLMCPQFCTPVVPPPNKPSSWLCTSTIMWHATILHTQYPWSNGQIHPRLLDVFPCKQWHNGPLLRRHAQQCHPTRANVWSHNRPSM